MNNKPFVRPGSLVEFTNGYVFSDRPRGEFIYPGDILVVNEVLSTENIHGVEIISIKLTSPRMQKIITIKGLPLQDLIDFGDIRCLQY